MHSNGELFVIAHIVRKIDIDQHPPIFCGSLRDT